MIYRVSTILWSCRMEPSTVSIIHYSYSPHTHVKTESYFQIIQIHILQNPPDTKISSYFFFSLVGGWATPLKNMNVNWDDEIPNIYGKIKFMATKPPTSSALIHRKYHRFFRCPVDFRRDLELPLDVSRARGPSGVRSTFWTWRDMGMSPCLSWIIYKCWLSIPGLQRGSP